MEDAKELVTEKELEIFASGIENIEDAFWMGYNGPIGCGGACMNCNCGGSACK